MADCVIRTNDYGALPREVKEAQTPSRTRASIVWMVAFAGCLSVVATAAIFATKGETVKSWSEASKDNTDSAWVAKKKEAKAKKESPAKKNEPPAAGKRGAAAPATKVTYSTPPPQPPATEPPTTTRITEPPTNSAPPTTTTIIEPPTTSAPPTTTTIIEPPTTSAPPTTTTIIEPPTTSAPAPPTPANPCDGRNLTACTGLLDATNPCVQEYPMSSGKYLTGALTIGLLYDYNVTAFFSNITGVCGNFILQANSGLSAFPLPNIQIVSGDFIVTLTSSMYSVYVDALDTVGGDFKITSNAAMYNISAVSLIKVGGSFEVAANSALCFVNVPNLATVACTANPVQNLTGTCNPGQPGARSALCDVGLSLCVCCEAT